MTHLMNRRGPDTSEVPIGVVSALQPHLLRDTLTRLISQNQDIRVVAEISSSQCISEAVERTGAEVVLLPFSSDAGVPELCRELLEAHPDLLILGVSADSNFGWAWHRGIQRVRLEEISPTSLQSAIRREFLHAA